MQYNNSHSWWHGGRRADGRCIACSQLITLSTGCTCWSSLPVTNHVQCRQGSDEQSPDPQEECESTDVSRKSSLLSAHSNGGTTASCSRRVSSDELTASCVSSAEECIMIEEMQPSHQSSLLSALGEQSVDGHSKKKYCKTHQLFNVSNEHDNRRYVDVRQASSAESLLSAKGSNPDNNACWLISDACQSSTTGCSNPLRQCNRLSTAREQSLDGHTTKDYCKFHQGCCASRLCDNRQHTNQLVRQVSSGEVSLLSAKGSNPNNDDWRLTDACQFNGFGHRKNTTQKSPSESSLLGNHTTKDHRGKAEQDFDVSSADDNGQQLDVRRSSSSEASLLSATGSSPNNNDCRLMTYAYQYNGIGSCKIVARECLHQSSLFSAVGEQSLKKHNGKVRQGFNAISTHEHQQHCYVRKVSSSEVSLLSAKGPTPNYDGKQNRTNAYQSVASGSGKMMDSSLNAQKSGLLNTTEEPSSASQTETHQDELNVNDDRKQNRTNSYQSMASGSGKIMDSSLNAQKSGLLNTTCLLYTSPSPRDS